MTTFKCFLIEIPRPRRWPTSYQCSAGVKNKLQFRAHDASSSIFNNLNMCSCTNTIPHLFDVHVEVLKPCKLSVITNRIVTNHPLPTKPLNDIFLFAVFLDAKDESRCHHPNCLEVKPFFVPYINTTCVATEQSLIETITLNYLTMDNSNVLSPLCTDEYCQHPYQYLDC